MHDADSLRALAAGFKCAACATAAAVVFFQGAEFVVGVRATAGVVDGFAFVGGEEGSDSIAEEAEEWAVGGHAGGEDAGTAFDAADLGDCDVVP